MNLNKRIGSSGIRTHTSEEKTQYSTLIGHLRNCVGSNRTPDKLIFFLNLIKYCCLTNCISRKTSLPTRMGFEPTRAEPIGLAVQRLNHSATSSHELKTLLVTVRATPRCHSIDIFREILLCRSWSHGLSLTLDFESSDPSSNLISCFYQFTGLAHVFSRCIVYSIDIFREILLCRSWSHGLSLTLDFESSDPSSNLISCFYQFTGLAHVFSRCIVSYPYQYSLSHLLNTWK